MKKEKAEEHKRNLSDNGKTWLVRVLDIDCLPIGCTRPFDILCINIFDWVIKCV